MVGGRARPAGDRSGGVGACGGRRGPGRRRPAACTAANRGGCSECDEGWTVRDSRAAFGLGLVSLGLPLPAFTGRKNPAYAIPKCELAFFPAFDLRPGSASFCVHNELGLDGPRTASQGRKGPSAGVGRGGPTG